MTLTPYMVEVGCAWDNGSWDTTDEIVFAPSSYDAEVLARKRVEDRSLPGKAEHSGLCGTFIHMIREAEEGEYSQEKYVAVSFFHWGKGPTPEVAIEQMRKAGFRGSAKGKVRIAELPDGVTNVCVDEFGSARWKWQDESMNGTIVRLDWKEL